MPTSTVEDYLKRLYLLQQRAQGKLVLMGDLAGAMGVTPGTATSMVKTLAESGLVSYEPRSGVTLTQQGTGLALHVLRRHRLVELFLVNVLGLDWSEVHAEAEELEHAISDKVLARIDILLANPKFDPHGDPIPSAKGQVSTRDLQSLAACETNTPVRVARVLDQDPTFLQFVDRSGLAPDSRAVVESRSDEAGAVTVTPDDHPPVTLGTAAAEKILVEASPD